jgi:hypothetical protein
MDGRNVHQEVLKEAKSDYYTEIGNLSDGAYVLRVTHTNGKVLSERLVVER